MPPLKKSYSDTRHQTKSRAQWQRTRSNPNANGNPPQPLGPVSDSARNKLQAFQFDGPPPKAFDDAPDADADATEPNKKTVGASASQKGEKGPLGAPVAKTPAGRPTWQDLLGGKQSATEEDVNSPSDRIIWLNENDPNAPPSASMSPMLSRRGRKRRARSSSPVSSPAAKAHVSNVARCGQQTPSADPAAELWDRFSVPGVAASPATRMNPLLARMMVSSSPRPPKGNDAPGAERSFRKANSCGSNWPKRRKMERLDLDPAPVSQGGEASTSKSTLVSALLETVEGEILKSVPESNVQGDNNSSPTFQRRLSPRKSRASGRQPSIPETVLEGRPVPISSSAASTIDHVDMTKAEQLQKPCSDYGDDDFDDDFDDDTLMELDVGITIAPVPKPQFTLVKDEGPAPAPPALPPPVPQVFEDEFGDLDDDDFADLDDDLFDGAEDLMAQVEAKPIPQPGLPGKQPLHQVEEEEDYGDDFGDDLDLDAIEFAATQSAMQAPGTYNSSQKPRAIQRYLITDVLERSYEDDRGCECTEKLLLVQADKSKTIKTIHLRGDWCDTEAHAKAFVHVIGDFDRSGRCVVDNTNNMLILHPDQLISATVLADSFMCTRRAVLQDRVKATGEASSAMIYGTILHEIFQEALVANNWDPKYLGSVVATTLEKHLEDLYIIKVSMDDARSHILSKMPEVRSWAQAFVTPQPKSEALVQGRNGERVNMCVSKLLDVEEHVWSPMYGLKGNIDATVQVTMQDKTGSKVLTVPFEVKTGKSVSTAHQAQTLLYNLLLSDRYDVEIMYGILYYMETSQTMRIPSVRHELRHMIMQRNRLAIYIRERSAQLPPMKREKFACGRCYAQTACFIYHKLADDGTGETSGVKEKFDEVVQHLTPKHKDFFLNWEDLLTKEEKESQKHRRELWTMVSTEREKLGRCLSNVIIEEGSAMEDKESSKINRFFYNFIKQTPIPGTSFLDSQLAVGEPIVVSDEQGHFALAIGFVTAVRKHKISVAVDRRLHNARIRQSGFDQVDNQVFASIMDTAAKGSKPTKTEPEADQPPLCYRLDKDEFSNGMATVRNNLIQVMADGPAGSRQLRSLVVDLVPPSFKTVPTQYTIADKDGLNGDQKRAIEKVMSAKDYALVLGMPGTGKTTTIAHIIRALISQGKTVLLTSYTHSAVDNILLKLKDEKIPILRLGAAAKVHPQVREFATLAQQPKSTFEEIRSAWHDTPIVATTCLGINHPLFNERTFDYCIVDEASQITLPVCLGPIRMARTFVLVGDHNQLPPLVQNEEARAGGLDVSLFKLLSDTHPDSVVNLEHQYRMCEDIMTLSNTLIYKGRLKCGTEALRSASLDVPNMAGLQQRHITAEALLQQQQQRSPTKPTASTTTNPSPQKPRLPPSPSSLCPGPHPTTCWLRDLVDPSARVRFVNTDALPDSREQAKGNRIVNPTEARVVAQLVDALVAVGVPASEVGVMTHYRSQLAQLRHLLRGYGGAVEMHTADRFQGRDKEVVVLSLVRSNEACSIGELLKDWRRINVAFTRAKTKLLVVGSRSTLGGCGEGEMIARFVGLMEGRGWVYDLPEGALEGHWFVEGGGEGVMTQGSPRKSVVAPRALGTTPKKKKVGTTPKGKVLGSTAGNPLVLDDSPSPVKKGRGKENLKEPKRRVGLGERAVLKGKPVLRDILNELGGGRY
ncbi:hypothetical protein QBC39DRAFT_404871 [Podospora conica]|nr:hypothetical protein QBC39DRAFT_404871 [Schizothecium conicum]